MADGLHTRPLDGVHRSSFTATWLASLTSRRAPIDNRAVENGIEPRAPGANQVSL
jgi:hypothetical protein